MLEAVPGGPGSKERVLNETGPRGVASLGEAGGNTGLTESNRVTEGNQEEAKGVSGGSWNWECCREARKVSQPEDEFLTCRDERKFLRSS